MAHGYYQTAKCMIATCNTWLESLLWCELETFLDWKSWFGIQFRNHRELMKFLLFNEVLKNLIFFQLPIKKVAFMTLILSKFQSLNANLWSIYSKRFEFMVYTFICAFWKIIFFWLLRPSKSSGALKKDSTFGFLTFGYALKN